MSYAARESETDYKIVRTGKGASGLTTSLELARTPTERTDWNDKETNPLVQLIENVEPIGSSIVGIVTHTAPQGGQSYIFTIESGDDGNEFTINSRGEITRSTPEVELQDEYALVVRWVEGAPLHRSGTTAVTIRTTNFSG